MVSTADKRMRPMYIINRTKFSLFGRSALKPVLKHYDLPNVKSNNTSLVSARPPNWALADPSLREPQHSIVEPYCDRFSDGKFFCFPSIIVSQTRLDLVT